MNRALAIKSETDQTLTLEGWGVVFGGEDLQGDYFDAKTNFWLTELGSTKPFLYDHGFDPTIKAEVLGTCSLELKKTDDAEGLWLSATLDKSRAYVAQVQKLAKAGALGASSGAVSHLVERDEAKSGAAYVKSWPIAEVSATVTPAEPRTLGVAEVRSLIEHVDGLKAKLDAAERDKLPEADFAYVDRHGGRHLPIHDEAHVRAAMGGDGFSKQQFESDAAKKKAAKKIVARARKFGIDVADTDAIAEAAKSVKSLSFEQLRDQVSLAIQAQRRNDEWDGDWIYVVATYPDAVIVQREDEDQDGDGGLWRFPYSIDSTTNLVTLGEPTRVETAYTPISEKTLRSLVEHAEALKGLLPKETPQGASSTGDATQQPTAEIKTSARTHTTPAQAQETSMTPEEMTTLTDSVSAKFAPQFDAISKILERFENEPALKNAGIVSADGGAADKHVKSFADYLVAIKRNDVKRLTTVYEAKAALAEDDGTTGGFLIPTEYRRDLLQIAAEQAIVRPRAFVLPMGARELEIPALDQTSAATSGQSAFFGGASFKWAAEAAAYDETEPKFKMIRLVAHKLEGYTLSSNEMLADSAIALEAFLRRLFGSALAWHEDYAFLQGNGVGKPLGVLNAPAAVAVTRNTGSSFKVQDIGGMLAALPASSFGNAVWLMNQSVIPQLIQLSLTNATIVSFVSSFRDKMPATLMGLPIAFTEKLPVLGTKGDVMLCDFSAYVVGDRQQVTIASSEHYKFINGQMTWRVDERVDGQPWLKSAIALQDGTTTVSPFVILN